MAQQEFLKNGDQEFHSLNAPKQEKWTETVENLNFQASSRKAWPLIRKLGGGNPPPKQKPPIGSDSVASNIVATSTARKDKAHTKRVKKQLRSLKPESTETEHSRPFTGEEISAALKNFALVKAPGFDGLHPEFLINSGKYVWLADFSTNIMQTGEIPQEFKRSKVTAIQRPGKPADQPKTYRPIALSWTMYKLPTRRLIYNRISPVILIDIPVEQAGFRPNRSCTDQVLSLTTYIEAGFQRQLKSSAAFIDLSVAYDTVWREGIPTASYLPAIKRFPTTPDYINSEISYESSPIKLANCTDIKKMWTPCLCHLEQCIGWYPCELKYCKGKAPTSSYRCGIKTCKICHLFVYYIAQKQQCLWDE
ncbi:hypothetical protein HUJ04_011582 [Dendroctonus ponderosae]|nr:hypothetical protein HUJ04_011582 [Dendroctonus ponderosae]